MLRIGLTGGIGAGKSTVSRRLTEHGALVVDADLVAREVVEPGTEGLAEVVRTFGARVLAPDGSLDRPALGRIVFADGSARAKLEAITHPRIFAETARRIAAAGDDTIVVHDVPLLVELGRAADYHLAVVVGAAEQVRHDRLVRDRGMDSDGAWARIRAQASDEQRRAAADVWLANEGTQEELVARVDRLWSDRLLPYDENLRLDRGVRRPSEVRITDYDPQWPVIAERLCRRITTQLSRAGIHEVVVDHIGSTAVPGLAAKDVIDLQIQVPELAVAQGDSFRAALRAAGVVDLRPNQDHPQPWDPDPERWRKFYANGADPAVVTHVHIRAAGGPAAHIALAFRDWLRADAGERASYEAMKRDVAQRFPGGTDATRGDYVDAKEPWFTQHLPRAHEWAARRGGATA